MFAHNWLRHNQKSRHAKRLLVNHDFVGLQETHGNEGRADIFRLPRHSVPFYSHHDTTRTAGIALWVKKAFLLQLHPVTPSSWIEISPGRAATLRLDGPQGSLDLCVLYLHSGARPGRRRSAMEDVIRALRPREAALTLLFGDWNFTTDAMDRFRKEDASWTGESDAAERLILPSL
jgi:hypothetical protein